jgi:hypothetical protein
MINCHQIPGTPAWNRAFRTGRNPALTPHPVQMYRQLPSHWYLRDFPSSAQGQVEELTAPLRLTAYPDLGRFYQQEAKQ